MKPLMLMKTKGITGPGFARHHGISGLSKAARIHNILPPLPKVLSSEIVDAKKDGILVVWNMPITMTCDAKDQIDIIIDGASPVHPQSLSINAQNPTEMAFIMAVPFTSGQVVTWAYDDTGPCDIRALSSTNEAENQTYAVHNAIA